MQTSKSAPGYFVPVDESGNIGMQLTGRKAIEIVMHNGLAIVDTANYDVVIDVSAYDRKNIFIVNLLNQSVTVQVFILALTGTSNVSLGTKVIASGTSGMITQVDFTAMLEPTQRYRVRLFCTVAPTSGTVTTYLEGSQK
jgi:hypothetical protein